MNPFDSYMLNKVRRLKDVRTRYAATGARRRPATGETPVAPVKDCFWHEVTDTQCQFGQ